MKERLFDALKAANADYVDIRIDDVDGSSFVFRGPEFASANTSKKIGGIIRACYKGGWSQVVFSSLDNLADKVSEACNAARLIGHETTQLAELATPPDVIAPAVFINDYRPISFEEKIAIVKEYNDIALKADPAIQSTIAFYGETFRKTWFASTRGNYFMEERPRMSLGISAMARDGMNIQRGYLGLSSTNNFAIFLNQQEKVRQTAQEALALLKAPQCPGGKFTVVLDNEMTGLFTHEAFGHLSEADFLYENKDMKDLMYIGRPIGAPDLCITDDGTRGTLLGTHLVDDEGTPTHRTELIRDGILVGHLHSLETAAKLGEQPTGNARAISYGVPPIVRMTNTFIEPGKLAKEDLFKTIDDGLYIVGGSAGQTQMEMFTFTARKAYRIQHGHIGELLRDVTLTGNVFQTLHDIDGIANDLVIHETTGGCGKGGQSPLPVTDGGPHIRIHDIVIGGKN